MISISEILDFINKNPWLNIVFILLTLISIFLSIWFYVKSKKAKKPTYCIRTINLVREKINKIESVEIHYQGNKIDNLSISKIAIWNAGKDTISNSDISQNDKFRIEIEGDDDILDYELAFEKNQANGFSLTKIDNKTLGIKFDYCDYNEGIIVQIYHTATNSSCLNIKGSFKGTKEILRNDSNTILPTAFYKVLDFAFIKPRLLKRTLGIITIILPMLLFIILFIDNEPTVKKESSLIGKIILIVFMIIPYWWVGYRTLRRRVPKGFYLFESEF